MQKFNLLEIPQKLNVRDLKVRENVSLSEKLQASAFGHTYFDGSRREGYGGYHYDGRWKSVAKRAIKHFDLSEGSKVLDLGCGKGFFVYDLVNHFGIDAYGLDISDYALKNCPPDVSGRLHKGSLVSLPFPNGAFDAVFCINTLHNLTKLEAFAAIQEMNRVVKQKSAVFIQVDACEDEEDREIFESWMLTANLYWSSSLWLSFFEECKFEGSYYWTILKEDGSVV